MENYKIGDELLFPVTEDFYPGMTAKIVDVFPQVVEEDGVVKSTFDRDGNKIQTYMLEFNRNNKQFQVRINGVKLKRVCPEKINPNQAPECICESRVLFNSGCQCGAFKKLVV